MKKINKNKPEKGKAMKYRKRNGIGNRKGKEME